MDDLIRHAAFHALAPHWQQCLLLFLRQVYERSRSTGSIKTYLSIFTHFFAVYPAPEHAAPAATPTPTHALTWMTVQRFSGNGVKKTQIITVPGDWKILYSCKGQDIGGTPIDGVLVVTVYDNQNNPVDVAVNATCKGTTKATTGETEEHQSGSVYLDVNGTGDWSLQVQVMK